MTDINIFHFDKSQLSFEDHGKANGYKYWYSSDLMKWLGYESNAAFQKAFNRALQACTALNIPIVENFSQVEREINGKKILDWKLSRYACYLTAMNGDPRKPQVARAQAYFVTVAQALESYIQDADNIERVVIRDEITEGEKSLTATAYSAGVQQYSLFQNAGYRGMYNMDMHRLKKRKGVPSDRSLLDFMGKDELAANLFRLTQTSAKIRNENIRGQRPLEDAAEKVGQKVRRTMHEISGTYPEYLTISQDIKQVKSGLKSTHREMRKLDKTKSPKALPAPSHTQQPQS
jgi:DNA-damage-inducible protein D